MISKIKHEDREKIAKASAKTLPNNPTGRGMTPEEIRSRFWEPIIASGSSLADEIDRVVDEANKDIEAAVAKAENELSTEKKARETSENGIREEIASVSDALDAHKAEVSVEAVGLTIPKRTSFGTLEAETDRKNAVQYPRRDKQLVNLGFFDSEMNAYKAEVEESFNAHKAEVAKTFNTLEEQINGKTTSYVIADRSTLVDLLSGRWDMGSTAYSWEYLRTGDRIFCIDTNIPDFWFEATTDTSREAEVYDGLTLSVEGYDSGLSRVGLLHILESNAVNFGDLEAALDRIIELQKDIIGGDA